MNSSRIFFATNEQWSEKGVVKTVIYLKIEKLLSDFFFNILIIQKEYTMFCIPRTKGPPSNSFIGLNKIILTVLRHFNQLFLNILKEEKGTRITLSVHKKRQK